MKNIVKTYTRFSFMRKFYLISGTFCQQEQTLDFYRFRFHDNRVRVQQVVSEGALNEIKQYLSNVPEYVLDMENNKLFISCSDQEFIRYQVFFLELMRRHLDVLVSHIDGVELNNPAVALYETFQKSLN